ncbi:MAG TPA: YceI family protein [Candidatus Acidoferrum sp.]|nr:YceI family protein [Candidatus Acidoferrum sp.]
MRQRGYGVFVAGRCWIFVFLILVTACAWPQTPQPALQTNPGGVTLNLDVAQSKLHWTLDSTLHTVHGTFNLKRGVVKFDPATGSASGEFVAYATSGDSGNDARNKKMHDEILESSRYPEVIFRPTKIEGKVAVPGTSEVQLHGKFLLHGSEHDLTVPVHAELTGEHWKGTAKFSVPYIQWGLKSPNTFLLKAAPVVEIELELSGTVHGAVAP